MDRVIIVGRKRFNQCSNTLFDDDYGSCNEYYINTMVQYHVPNQRLDQALRAVIYKLCMIPALNDWIAEKIGIF